MTDKTTYKISLFLSSEYTGETITEKNIKLEPIRHFDNDIELTCFNIEQTELTENYIVVFHGTVLVNKLMNFTLLMIIGYAGLPVYLYKRYFDTIFNV